MARTVEPATSPRAGAVFRARALHDPALHDPEASEPAAPTGDRPSDAAVSGFDEVPDPRFWGPEPRSVRRSGGAVRPGRARADQRASTSSSAWSRVQAWWEALRARFPGARVEVGIGALAVVAVALVAGVIWYRVGASGGGAPPATAGRPAAARRAAAPARSTSATATTLVGDGRTAAPAATHAASHGPAVVVHVAGAVRTPGVLELPAGARVIDAVEGAGGANPDADLDHLNLAAKLVDGQRILVLQVGAVAAAPAPGGSGGSGGSAVADAPPIDLNGATVAQLDTLPGIGPTLAGAIIAERDRRGGFRSINELREVRGIGEQRFADLRERVTV